MRHHDGGDAGFGNRARNFHIAVMKREHDIRIRQRRFYERGVLGVDRKERARVTAAQCGKALEGAHDIPGRGVKTETEIDDVSAAFDEARRLCRKNVRRGLMRIHNLRQHLHPRAAAELHAPNLKIKIGVLLKVFQF